jgi:hypothetical protein
VTVLNIPVISVISSSVGETILFKGDIKMFRKIGLVTVLFFCVCVTGCLSSKSYIDPQFKKAAYSDIGKVATKYKGNIDVEFQRNGEHLSNVDKELRTHVEKVFRATGVVEPVTEPVGLKIKVIANNIGDLGEARRKGFATGLTFGAAGSTVTDYYDFTIEYQNGSTSKSFSYKHAIHTTVGNRSAPIPVEPVPLAEAFGKVVEDIILNFVRDMQQSGELT